MDCKKIQQLIREGNTEQFYNDWKWRRLAAEIRMEQHSECQHCKQRGKYTRGRYVHHVNHLKDRPDLAYSKTYIDESGNEQKNLILLCFDCHEAEHPERFKHEKKHFQNEERW